MSLPVARQINWIVLVTFLTLAGTAPAGNPDYVRDIKPILANACYKCHGASAQKGGLRLDTAALAQGGGDNGPSILPGNATDSLLIRAILGQIEDMDRMPLKRPALTESQITLIKLWIDQGANAPENELPEDPDSDSGRHWAFVPPERPEAPPVKNHKWGRNAIDRFVLARLEQEQVKPSPEADRATLIRRVSLDLTGLPPSIAEVDAFVKDRRPDAYESLVARLLASPHHGERWGRHWLDVARYADSNGYSVDSPRQIWRYRDWVIDALNSDLPFDQFAIEQLAGDLLPDATMEQKIATGFHRNTQINTEGGIDKEQFRVDSVIDRVNTTATAFLGLTVGCAQCHDHKYDPVTQREYFQLFAFFNNADEPDLELAMPEELSRRAAIRKEIGTLEADLKKLNARLSGGQVEWELSLTGEEKAKLKADIIGILGTPPEERTAKQKTTLAEAYFNRDPGNRNLRAKIADLEKQAPKFPTTMVMKERSEPRESRLLIQGDYTRPGEVVAPGVPQVLPPLQVEERLPNRLDLARWLVDSRNPLTARVTMNRVWQHYFGRGLVETENDFGLQGAPPSHPELLDWLATEFVRQGWSLKAMHRIIVTSSTYRQSSVVRPELADLDPHNRLLARQGRLRLDAEIIRDVSLAASGLIDGKVGGPSVYPPQPDGVMDLGQIKRAWETSAGADRYRRGMYTHFWRATPHPSLVLFDAPDATTACTRRNRSNTPLQSLTLLNDEAFYECARALARRVLEAGPKGQGRQIDFAFRLALGRSPSKLETQRLSRLLQAELSAWNAPEGGEGTAASGNQALTSAWTTLARVLLNLDETITRE